ncbi:tetrapyrrole (Corrin/Porphyrin) methylase family protein [Bifidobacterium adolescentis]|nr:tetrapyrrole (Corrin/Porphyrin) methylase family protein [Bifidobacterium adolescentis]
MGDTGNMENLSEQTDAEKAGNAVKQTVKTNIGQIAEIGENAENAEETAQATERAEFGLDGLVADVNIPRGTVVLAATPIGNTGDASARLIALMEGADIVAAEDTRRLYALANRLGIRVPGRVVAYHDHNERDKADGLLDQVEQGATVLVVSDAGMQRAGVRRHRPDALPGDGNETTPPVPAILPKKSLRTALNVGGSLQCLDRRFPF